MIQLSHVNLTFPLEKSPILRDVNISICEGEWVSLIGPSGSGKTTLLEVLSGKFKSVEGDIFINKCNLNKMNVDERHDYVRNNVATVYQQYRLLPQFNVLANVMLPLIPYSKKKKEIERKALELIKEVGLDHRINHFPKQLSGGEQQRVAVARALLSNPPILLCDEPTGNLDSKNRDIILDLISKIHRNGKTILLVTHDNIVASKGDTILTFQDGTLNKGVPSS